MNLNEYLIVKVTADMKNYVYWVVDANGQPAVSGNGGGVPLEPLNAISNRTTSKSTLGTNIQNEMPTLGT